MALESTRLAVAPASRIAAIAGRFATSPERRPEADIHPLHGSADPAMPVVLAQDAQARLSQLGASVTLDIAPGVGHEPHPALLERLAGHLPPG